MSLFEMLTEQLKGPAMEQISRQIGADQGTTEAALPGALGSLLGGLAKNTSQSGGAAALNDALAKDHDGSILDDLGGFLNNPSGGGGILKHILGGNTQAVEAGISQGSGLNQQSTDQLLKVLAPIVLGALGKAKNKGGLDAGSLAGILAGERKEMAQKAPKEFGMLSSLLDADGDGDIVDDIASKVGGSLLKNLFK